jgi:hypothetical protein
MRNLSILLTVLLILPMVSIVFSAYNTYSFDNIVTHHMVNGFFLWQMLSPLIIDFIFLVIAIYLNFKRKFFENSIMCGTLVFSFILFFTMNICSSVVYHWIHYAR